MAIDTNAQKIEEVLDLKRNVENIYPNIDALRTELKSGKQLVFYSGYDPTAPTLHIGHGITMLKLRQLQDLGHKVIMLIGDFTGMIGDPTDKSAARQKLTREQVLENCKEYKKQAARILNFEGENPVEVKFNSEWLKKMSFEEVIELSSHFTVQRMLERDMFERRMSYSVICPKCKQDNYFPISAVLLAQNELPNWKIDTNSVHVQCTSCGLDLWDKAVSIITPNSKPIYLHEFLYPLMQGYDSVAMDVDGEVGGNDQTFNMLAGRTLMKEIKHKEKFVIATKLLADETGKKMSKTEGNMIALSDTPEDMFGKVMRWSDAMIWPGFDLCTRVATSEIEKMKADKNFNPRDLKLRLAYEITKVFLGEGAAEKGKANFASVIQSKEKPTEIPELKPSAYDIISILVESKIAKSKSDARKLVEQGGVKINDEKVVTIDAAVKAGDVVQKGSRFFVKVI